MPIWQCTRHRTEPPKRMYEAKKKKEKNYRKRNRNKNIKKTLARHSNGQISKLRQNFRSKYSLLLVFISFNCSMCTNKCVWYVPNYPCTPYTLYRTPYGLTVQFIFHLRTQSSSSGSMNVRMYIYCKSIRCVTYTKHLHKGHRHHEHNENIKNTDTRDARRFSSYSSFRCWIRFHMKSVSSSPSP